MRGVWGLEESGGLPPLETGFKARGSGWPGRIDTRLLLEGQGRARTQSVGRRGGAMGEV